MTRRHLLATLLTATSTAAAGAATKAPRLGLGISSYTRRWRGEYSSFKTPPFRTVLDVLDHVRGLGIGSLQIGVSDWTLDLAKDIRQTCESYDLAVEGSVLLPLNEGDTGRFERELRTAREAGVTIFRSAQGGRRYEVFTRRDDFDQWQARALRSMALAEPIAKRLKVRVGIENHKDWQVAELVRALTSISSESLGACVDTGNSVALLEDPLEVVRALAPFAVTVHLKDVAVRETPLGFLLSEVPLGQGCLDLPEILRVLQAAQPAMRFHLEMITRDPLLIPCFTEAYWATFPDKPALDLVKTLAWVRAQAAEKLVKISGLSNEAVLKLEEDQIQSSLHHAGLHLGFDQIQVRKPGTTPEK